MTRNVWTKNVWTNGIKSQVTYGHYEQRLGSLGAMTRGQTARHETINHFKPRNARSYSIISEDPAVRDSQGKLIYTGYIDVVFYDDDYGQFGVID